MAQSLVTFRELFSTVLQLSELQVVEKNTYADKQKKKITFFNVAMSLQSRGKVVVYPMNTNNVKLSYDVLQSRHTAHKEVGTGGGGVRRWGDYRFTHCLQLPHLPFLLLTTSSTAPHLGRARHKHHKALH